MKLKTTLARLALTTAAVAFGATMALADGTVVAVVGGKADDAFFAKVKKGIDDATLVVQAHGGTVNYLIDGLSVTTSSSWGSCAEGQARLDRRLCEWIRPSTGRSQI